MNCQRAARTPLKVYRRNTPARRFAWLPSEPTIKPRFLSFALLSMLACLLANCGGGSGSSGDKSVRPRALRDVPAQRLAYRFEADTAQPTSANTNDASAKLPTIQNDFDSRRKDDALLRTVPSPDGQRALALYATGQDEPGEFRIDMYSADGNFLRNLTPPELSGEFAPSVAWSPDGNHIAFIGRKSLAAQRTPAPSEISPDAALPMPAPNAPVAPVFALVPVYKTEQVYVCNRDGFDLKPLTAREGLIYFYVVWAPDAHAISALACKENEWDAREKENRSPAGRPRLLNLDGQERLLDDALTDAFVVWSPDASKVATAFDTDVAIYDAATNAPTGARLPLREPLLAASVAYDERSARSKPAANANNKASGKANETSAVNNRNTAVTANTAASQTNRLPISFNSIVRLEWTQPETIYVQTGFVRIYANGPVNRAMRWHTLHLAPQAAILK